MGKRKEVDKLPAALRNHVTYNGKVITCRDWINALIKDGYTTAEFYHTKTREQAVLKKGKLISEPFRNLAELEYIREQAPHITQRIAQKGAVIPALPPDSSSEDFLSSETLVKGEAKDGAKLRSLCPVGTEIQSLVLEKKVFTKGNAMDWVYKHKFDNSTHVDEKEKTYRFRQIEPWKFKQDSFATIQLSDGVQAVIGCPLTKAELGALVPVQNGKQGAIIQGPDHEHGGVDVVVNGKPVIEAKGNEIIMNEEASKKHCEKLSEMNVGTGGIAFDCPETADKGSQLTDFNLSAGQKYTSDDGEIEIVDCYTNPAMYGHGAEKMVTVRSKHMDSPYQMEEADVIKWLKDTNAKLIAAQGAVLPSPVGEGLGVRENDPYSINKRIEKLIDEKGEDGNNYSLEEKNFLRRYSGYGGIKSEQMTAAEVKGSFTEFYTPTPIIQKMWALAYKYGFKDGGTVLEPAVGTGEFLKYVPENSTATGYEINKYSYIISKILYPGFYFKNQPFEQLFIKDRDSVKGRLGEHPKYDLVIGNPPYGDVGGIGMGMGEKQYTKAGNWIEYFIVRGLDLTKPRGLLIYIIGTEVSNGGVPWLQQEKSKVKEMVAERADLVDAYRLPNGVFDRTDVLTDIVVFKKK